MIMANADGHLLHFLIVLLNYRPARGNEGFCSKRDADLAFLHKVILFAAFTFLCAAFLPLISTMQPRTYRLDENPHRFISIHVLNRGRLVVS